MAKTKLYTQYKKDQRGGGGASSTGSLYNQYKNAIAVGQKTGNSIADEYIAWKRQENQKHKEAMQARQARINRERLEEQQRQNQLNQQRAATTDFMRAQREELQNAHAAKAQEINSSRHPSAYQDLQSEGTWQQEVGKLADKNKMNWEKQENLKRIQYQQEIERSRTGFQSGDQFVKYDELRHEPDYTQKIEEGRNKDNIFSTQSIFGPLDYLNKEKRQVLRAANKNFTYMSDTEKDMYHYLNGKFGAKAASDYMDSLGEELNRRSAEWATSRTEDVGKRHPVASTIMDSAFAMAGSGAYPYMIARNGYNRLTGRYDEIDINDPVFGSTIINEGLRSGIKDNETLKKIITNEGVRNFAVDTGLSMTENIARLPLGNMGLAAAAGGAGLSGTRDAVKSGGSTDQAIFLGMANAAAEAFFEKFSLENLKSLKATPATSVRSFFANIGKQAFTEGSEEVFTEIANTISDNAIMGNLSQYNQDYEQYKMVGLDDEDAKKQAFLEFMKRVGLAGLGGALSGGVMGGGAQAMGLAGQELYYRDIGRDINADYRDYANSIDTDRNAYQNEQDYNRAVELQQLSQEYAERQMNREFIPNSKKGRFDEQITEFVSNLNPNETLPEVNSMQTNSPAQEAEMHRNGDFETKPTVSMESLKNGQETEIMKPKAETQSAEQQRVAGELPESLTEAARQYGRNGKMAYVDNYDSEMDLPAYSRAFGRVYDAGRYGAEMALAEHSAILSVMSSGQVEEAFKAGAQDRLMDQQAQQAAQTALMEGINKGVTREGGMLSAPDTATAAQKHIATSVGKLTGLQVELVDGLSNDAAQASYQDGKMTISINSDDFLGSVAHEAAHFIKEYSPELYGVYRDGVVKSMMEAKGVSYEALMDSYNQAYERSGQTLSRDEVLEEIVADAAQDFFNNEESIRRLVKENRTIGERMVDFLTDIIDAVKELIRKGTSRKAAQALAENVKNLEYCRDIFSVALEDAGDAYKAGAQASETAERFKLKNPDGVRKERIEENYDAVRKMNPVISLTGNEFQKGSVDLITQVADFYKSEGGKVHNEVVGDIILDRNSVKDDIGHGIGRAKAISFSAVPAVLQDGRVLDYRKNWKNRGYDTVAIGAKINVAEGKQAGDYFEVAIVNILDDNRMYLHEVHTIKMEDITPFKTPDLKGNTRSDAYDLPSIYSIFNKLMGVKENESSDGEKVRYQLDGMEIEDTDDKNLVAIHNLTENKLMKLLKYEAIPMPSIAVTKADLGHENFGDISLVFYKDTIDPKNRKNKVYGADAWTPTFPRIEYDINPDVPQKLYIHVRTDGNRIPESLKDDAYRAVSSMESELENSGDVAAAKKKLEDNTGMKAVYIANQGQTVPELTKEVREEISEENRRIAESVIREYGADGIERMRKMPLNEFYENHAPRMQEIAEQEGARHIDVSKWRNSSLIQRVLTRRLENISEYLKDGGVKISTVEDTEAERAWVDERINMDAYRTWIDNTLEGAILDSGIPNGKDPFDSIGNRRSFKKTHYSVNAKNIVKSMMAQGDVRNVSGFNGIKSIRAVVTEDFRSINDIRRASEKIVNIDTDEYNKIKNQLDDRLYDVIEDIISQRKGFGSNPIIDMDMVGNLIIEAAKKPTAKNIKSILDQSTWKISEQQAEEIADIIKEVARMPVNMFEAKPQRAVGYEEVAFAAVPYSISDQARSALEEKGIPLIKYDPEIKDARRNAINQKRDVRFQLENVDDTGIMDKVDNLIRENQELREANTNLEKQFELTAKSEVRQVDIRRIAGRVLRDYNSRYRVESLANNLTKLYEYIRSSDHVDGREVTRVATAIGKSILKQSQQIDTELTEQYKDLRRQIRETTLSISAEDRNDLDVVGGYQEFRKKNFGRIKLGNGGISVDSLYQELSEQYPELFPYHITHPAEQLIAISDTLDMTSEQVKNPYHADMEEMSYIVGQELLDGYFDVRQPQPTFADKKAQEMQRVRRDYTRKMTEYKDKLSEQYSQKLEEIQKQNYWKIQQLTERYNQSQGEQREKYKQQINNLRSEKNQKLAAMQRKNQEQIRRIRDRQKAVADKKIIIKEVNTMSKWLLKPTEQKHIPEGLRGTIANFLSNIDFSSNELNNSGIETQRTLAWKDAAEAFDKIKKAEGMITDDTGCELYIDLDPDMVDRVKELSEKVRGIDKLDNLDAYSMEELKKVVYSMKKALFEVNSLKSNKKYREVSQQADAVFHELEHIKNRTEYTKIIGGADKMLNFDMLDAQTMFEQMGSAMKSSYAALRAGLDHKTVKLKQAQDYMQQALETNQVKTSEIQKWSGIRAESRTFSVTGGTIKLTVSQIMSLYELNKRNQAKGHIYNRNGGIKQAPHTTATKFINGKVVTGKIVKQYTPVRVTEMDVQRIIDTLTPQQKNLADAIQNFMGDNVAEWGNEVTMELYGYKKFTAKDYFPIVTDKNYIGMKEGDTTNQLQTIKKLGITKSTVQHANNPIIIEDIFEVFTRQVDQMSSYNAYVIPLSDFQKVYNYKDMRNTAGGGSIQQEIERTFGSGGVKYIRQLLIDINGSINSDRSFGDVMLANMKAASVAGNLRVAIQQPTAYVRAAMEISPKYLLQGAAAMTQRGQWDMICKYAPIAQWKDWGFYRMETSRQLKDIMFGTDSLKNQLVEKTMFLAAKGDELAWNRLWRACEYETRDLYPELNQRSEAYYQKVGDRFSEIVDKTQVVDSILHRTQIMRSQNGLNKLATAFMAEPLKTYDMLYRAALDLRQKKPGSKGRAVRAAGTYVATSALAALAAAVIDATRDDERDKDWAEKYWENVKANMRDGLNLFNNIPWVKDAISITQGYSATRSDVAWIQDLYYAGNRVHKLWKGDSKWTPQSVVIYTLQQSSKMTGLPIKSITRDAIAVMDTMMNNIGGEADYYWIKQQYAIYSDDNRKMYVTMMRDSLKTGNPDLSKRIREDLIKAGIPEEKINDTLNQIVNEEIKESVDILGAVETYNAYDKESQKVFQEQVRKYIELKKEVGWDEEKCIKEIRDKITKYYKPMWQEAKTQKDKDAIIKKCNQLFYNHNSIYAGYNFNNWKKIVTK